MPWGRTSAVWLIGWLAVALAVRLAAAGAVERIVSATPGRLCLIEGDANGYWELGRKLARGDEYSLYEPPRRILRMPGFPLILAGCQLVFGDNVFAVRCVLSLIGTLGCGLVYVLGRDLVDSTVGLWACALVSLSPPLIVFTPLLLTETAFATALVGSLIPVVRLVRQDSATPRYGMAALGGVAIAVATYIRPTWLPVIAAGMLCIVWWGRGQRRSWWEAGVMLLAFAALLAPWTYRNYVVSGHVVPTTLWVGPSLYDGLNPDATGDSDMTFFDRDNLLAEMSEYDMDRAYRRRAWDFAGKNPGRAMELAAVKAARYWSPWPNAPQFQRPLLQVGLALVTLPLYLLAGLGLWRKREVLFWLTTLGPVLFFGLVHMLFVGSIRYRLPAEYPLWIAAAVAAVRIWRRWRGEEFSDERNSSPCSA